MNDSMVRITITLPRASLYMARRVVKRTGTTLAGMIRESLDRKIWKLAEEHDIEDTGRPVVLRPGRPRKVV